MDKIPSSKNYGIMTKLKAEQSRNLNLIDSAKKQPQNIV